MSSASPSVAFVTGASSGIGRATAALFAARGYRVFGTTRVPDAVTALPGVTFVALDVRDDVSVRAAVADVFGEAGRIDVLVNNAGYAVVGPLEETSARQAAALLDTNVLGALRVTQAVLPGMRARRAGRVVNVSSAAGFVPAPFMGAYAASKHALEGMSESLDHEVRRFGVRVILVEPGFVRTNIVAAQEAADTPMPAYDADRRRALALTEAGVAGAPGPEAVAAAVVGAATAARPRLRYPVGRDTALLARLRRLLPAPLFDRAVRQQFRLDRADDLLAPAPHARPA